MSVFYLAALGSVGWFVGALIALTGRDPWSAFGCAIGSACFAFAALVSA